MTRPDLWLMIPAALLIVPLGVIACVHLALFFLRRGKAANQAGDAGAKSLLE